jgi:hypothetical protein
MGVVVTRRPILHRVEVTPTVLAIKCTLRIRKSPPALITGCCVPNTAFRYRAQGDAGCGCTTVGWMSRAMLMDDMLDPLPR